MGGSTSPAKLGTLEPQQTILFFVDNWLVVGMAADTVPPSREQYCRRFLKRQHPYQAKRRGGDQRWVAWEKLSPGKLTNPTERLPETYQSVVLVVL